MLGPPRPLNIQLGTEIKKGGNTYVAYTGISMFPTFQELDLMVVVPFYRPPKVGDVVLFHHPENSVEYVVHRVVGLKSAVMLTQGDNNRAIDPWQIQAGDIVGKVIALRRGKKQFPVRDGRVGIALLDLHRTLFRLDWKVSQWFRPVYHYLARQKWLVHTLSRWFKPRLVVFRVGNNQVRRLMIGQRLIGDFDREHNTWKIRRPYYLIVDLDRIK